MPGEQYFLKSCVEKYNELRDKYSEFCRTIETTFNDNEYYPGVRFEPRNDGKPSSLYALGNEFSISFELSFKDGTKFGLLKAETKAQNDSGTVLLHYVYFDRLGNVRRERSGACESDSLPDKAFVSRFLDEMAQAYLDFLIKEHEIANNQLHATSNAGA